MFTINAEIFKNGIESAMVGGGVGFVMMVNPAYKGPNGVIQVMNISSSDGDKSGNSNIVITAKDMKEPITVYPVKELYSAVNVLSKVTDVISVEIKDSFMELSDGKDGAVVQVGLMPKDVYLQASMDPDGVVFVTITKEKLTSLIRMGGLCADDSREGTDYIYFSLNGEMNRMTVASYNGGCCCKAAADIESIKYGVRPVQNLPKEEVISRLMTLLPAEEHELLDPLDEEGAKKKLIGLLEQETRNKTTGEAVWHSIPYEFARAITGKLTGEMIQMAFTPTFIYVLGTNGSFVSKKVNRAFPTAMKFALEEEQTKCMGKISKKDLLLGIEMATVGLEKKDQEVISLAGDADGTINCLAVNGCNKMKIEQLEHEGVLDRVYLIADSVKMFLGVVKDHVGYYLGKSENMFHFSYEDDEMDYKMLTLMVNMKKREELLKEKKEKKKDKEEDK